MYKVIDKLTGHVIVDTPDYNTMTDAIYEYFSYVLYQELQQDVLTIDVVDALVDGMNGNEATGQLQNMLGIKVTEYDDNED